jgi:SAM-dependent methyltransferase
MDPQKVLAGLAESAWALNAFGTAAERGLLSALVEPRTAAELARQTALPPHAVQSMLEVLTALGLLQARGGAFAASEGLAALLKADGGRLLAADLRSTLGQLKEVVETARAPGTPIDGWRALDPAVVEAQAVVSEGATTKMVPALSMLEGLYARLESPGAKVLDVGAGGAGFCIALARRFPHACFVGLEPAPLALEIGRRRVAEAGLQARIELDSSPLERFDARDAFDLAYVAAMFMPDEVLAEGLPRVLRALRPGGWLISGTLCPPGEDLGSAVSRFRSSIWGGGRRHLEELRAQLERAGFTQVVAPPVPSGALQPIAARRPQ